jgi:hypothetical protein
MRIDFRKTALITAIAVVLAQVYRIYVTILTFSDYSWLSVVLFAASTLLPFFFPVFLFLLYKTGTVPAVFGRLRNLAIAVALIYSVRFLANSIYVFSQIDHTEYLKYSISLVPEIVYIVFLVSLSLQSQGRPAANKRQAKLVWDVAPVTLFAVWISTAIRMMYVGVSMADYERGRAALDLAGGSERWIFHLQHAGEILSLFCSAIAVWVLYKGLSIAYEPFLRAGDSATGKEPAKPPASRG